MMRDPELGVLKLNSLLIVFVDFYPELRVKPAMTKLIRNDNLRLDHKNFLQNIFQKIGFYISHADYENYC